MIKTRNLFYNKYKKTKDMKFTKLKVSKTQIDMFNNENDLNNKNENIIKFEKIKNLGQHTMFGNNKKNKEIINLMNFNLLRRIYSYIRLQNINRINFPKENQL